MNFQGTFLVDLLDFASIFSWYFVREHFDEHTV